MLVDPRGIELFEAFYAQSYEITRTFPQYFRFFLGLAQDLEYFGLKGSKSTLIVQYIEQNELLKFDTSYLRQLETLHLISRSRELSKEEKDLLCHIHKCCSGFLNSPGRFTKFNRPLFYELTHIVFLLTDYGRAKLQHTDLILSSLWNAGSLAYLDCDIDLLSEIALCFNFIGENPPLYWSNLLTSQRENVRVVYDVEYQSAGHSLIDEYHLFLVLHWWYAENDQTCFDIPIRSQRPVFQCIDRDNTLLSEMSSTSLKCLSNQQGPISISRFISDTPSASLKHILSDGERGCRLIEEFSNGMIKT